MATRTVYIQCRGPEGLETIEEVDVTTRAEQDALIRSVYDYNKSDMASYYYTSSRPCKHWKEKA